MRRIIVKNPFKSETKKKEKPKVGNAVEGIFSSEKKQQDTWLGLLEDERFSIDSTDVVQEHPPLPEALPSPPEPQPSHRLLTALRLERADVHLAIKKLEQQRQVLEKKSSDLSSRADWHERHPEAEEQVLGAFEYNRVRDIFSGLLAAGRAEPMSETKVHNVGTVTASEAKSLLNKTLYPEAVDTGGSSTTGVPTKCSNPDCVCNNKDWKAARDKKAGA